MNKLIATLIFLTAFPFMRMPSASVLASTYDSKDEFVLNAIGDVQVGNDEELNYALRTLWPMLQNQSPKSVNLFLGDLVNNNTQLYPELSRLINLLPSRNYAVVGNHDRIPLFTNPTNMDSARIVQTEPFRKYFGPDFYSFDYRRLHVIVLNNIMAKGKRGYTGTVSQQQLDFIANDLQHVKRNHRILLAMHIPLARTSNRSELLRLFEHRNRVIVLTGHMHQVARYHYDIPGTRIDELVAGATCGFWWVGEKDFRGIPSALMQCGTPKGFFRFHFTKGGLQHTYHFVPTDSRSAVNVWVAGRDTLDRHVDGLDTIADGRVLITVYGASDSTKVRIRIDGGNWIYCTHSLYPDPNVARQRAMYTQHIYPTQYNRRNPLRNIASRQVWTIMLPEELRHTHHVIQVEAEDNSGFRAKY